MTMLTPYEDLPNYSDFTRDLTKDALTHFHVAISGFEDARRRAGQAYIDMALQLAVMQEILGDNFHKFAKSQLGLSEQRLKQYLALNDFMKTHFSVNGALDYRTLRNIPRRALELMRSTENQIIIDEVKQIVAGGEKISVKEVQEIIERNNTDAEIRIETAERETEATRKEYTAIIDELKRNNNAKELQIAKLGLRLGNLDEHVLKLSDQRDSLQKEILELRNRPPEIVTREVATLPSEYQTLEEAISHKEQLLKITKQQYDNCLRQKTDVEVRLKEMTMQADEFETFMASLNQFVSMCSSAYIKSLANINDDTRKLISEKGTMLNKLGQIFKQAARV